MTSPLLSLPLALLLAAGPEAPPPAQRDFDSPPPGAGPSDRALWQTAYGLNNELVIEQHAAARLTHRAREGRYDERLAALAGAGALPRERADELLRGLTTAWTANVELVRSQWPVGKLRVCRYEQLNFEGVLFSDDPPGRSNQLVEARRELERCTSRATSVLRALRGANEALAAEVARLDLALAALQPAGPAAGGGAPRREEGGEGRRDGPRDGGHGPREGEHELHEGGHEDGRARREPHGEPEEGRKRSEAGGKRD